MVEWYWQGKLEYWEKNLFVYQRTLLRDPAGIGWLRQYEWLNKKL
jgi:hypothetical protein